MIIGGFQKCSLIDYPGKISAIVFTFGCNLRCRYCHNPELVTAQHCESDYTLPEIMEFLQHRRGKLDAVTITGGEPTLQPDLIEVIQHIKQLGYLIKLDTNGTNPKLLKACLDQSLLDYVAMDMKAPYKLYPAICGPATVSLIKQSVKLLLQSPVESEFRTTIVKSLLSLEDLQTIIRQIVGAKHYYMQNFVPSKILDPSLANEASYSQQELSSLETLLTTSVKHYGFR